MGPDLDDDFLVLGEQPAGKRHAGQAYPRALAPSRGIRGEPAGAPPRRAQASLLAMPPALRSTVPSAPAAL